MKTTKISINELVLDFNFYPRGESEQCISMIHVKDIMEAIRAGETMPPITVCKDTMKISDGFNRYFAFKNLKHKTINAVLKKYGSEQEFYLDCYEQNRKHGLKLDRFDQVRFIIKGLEMGISQQALAQAMRIMPDRFDALLRKKTTIDKSGKIRALKGTARHYAGKQMTDKQLKGSEKSSGMPALFYVNQLINILESEIYDVENEAFMEAIKKLDQSIRRILDEKEAPQKGMAV